MFKLESTYDGAGTVVNTVPLTDSEASTSGEALVLTSGKATKCGATVVPQAIAAQTVAAGTNKTVDIVRVREDQIFLADYTTAASAVPVIGTKYAISADGLKVDADVTLNGVAEILAVNTTNKKCRVKFAL